MKKALASIIVSIAMVSASVSGVAADTAGAVSTNTAQAVQTGPLSPGGPVHVSPAQGNIGDDLCGPYGDCTPLVVLAGMIGMGVVIAALMGAFTSAHTTSKFTPTTTTTGTGG